MKELKSQLESYRLNPSEETRNSFYTILFKEYYVKACRWAKRRNPAYFKDIVANVFLKLLNKDPDKYDLSNGLDKLIYTSVKNESISCFRNNKTKDATFSIDEKYDSLPSYEDPYENIDRIQLLKYGFSQLPIERRKVLELKLEGFKEIEIADILGISIKKVKKHTYRGKENLKKIFEAVMPKDELKYLTLGASKNKNYDNKVKRAGGFSLYSKLRALLERWFGSL